MQLILRALKICFFVIIFISNTEAQNASETQLKHLNHIIDLITKNGTEVRSNLLFYQGAADCYSRNLKHILYFKNTYKTTVTNYLIVFNDKKGNCIFSSVPGSIMSEQEAIGGMCLLTFDQYKKMITPWYRDAVSYYDQTKQENPLFLEFMLKVRQCAKPTSLENILSLLQSSTQIKPAAQ